jgi:HSP20 family protein
MVRNLCTWRDGNVVPFEELYKEMDNLMGGLLSGNQGRGNVGFAPRINVAETETDFEVTADLPGIKADDVSVELHDGQLTISGHRESHTESKEKTFHRVERTAGEFRRVISVGVPVDEDKISAEYTDGVLRVTLPKSEKLRPKKIEVRKAASSN